MKYLCAILFNVLIFTTLFSQNPNYLHDNDTSLLFQKKTYPAINKYDNKSRFHFGAGASVTSFGNNTVFSKWIAPSFTYPISPKLNLHIGTLVLNRNSNSQLFNSEQLNAERSNPTQAFLFVSGDYQLNKNIRFRATTFNEIRDKNSTRNSFNYNQVGVDIKVTDNFFISADFVSEKGFRPFGMYSNSMFYDSNDPFGRGFFNTGW